MDPVRFVLGRNPRNECRRRTYKKGVNRCPDRRTEISLRWESSSVGTDKADSFWDSVGW